MPAPAMKPPAAPPTSAARQRRMLLSAVSHGKRKEPLRIALYGVEGIGKSTFGADAPSPIFLGAEDGTNHLDAARFPTPLEWQDILDAVGELTEGEHEYKTLVVDTLDWVEPLIWKHVCKADGAETIEEVGGGYGKGYNAALDYWRILLGALERLQKTRGMDVLFLAHSWVKTFKNPEGDDFDRYEMKLHAKAAGLMKEWCDAVLFTKHETFAVKDKSKRVRGVSSGARLIYTDRTAAYDAKNRFGLPPELPLSWADFRAAVDAHQPASPEALTSEIERKAKLLGGELETQALAALKRANGDAVKLSQLNTWANAKLAEKGIQQ